MNAPLEELSLRIVPITTVSTLRSSGIVIIVDRKIVSPDRLVISKYRSTDVSRSLTKI
jgi:hypothetical protein